MASDIAFNKILDGLASREQRIAQTRLAAARLVLGIAMPSRSGPLLADVLNHLGITEEGGPAERQERRSTYTFSLEHADVLQLSDVLLPAPRAVSIRTRTAAGAGEDHLGVTFYTDPDAYTLGLHLQLFDAVPHWSRDIGEAYDDGGALELEYSAHEADSPAALGAHDVALSSCLLLAKWQETAVVGGDPI